MKLDYEQFKDGFGEWAELFKPFIEGPEMYEIYQKLKKDSEREIIVPNSDQTFRAFKECNPAIMKVVFMLMDPYPRKYKNGALQATGIAMDCSNSPDGIIQPSLKKFYDGIADDTGKIPEHSSSLSYLHEQGCMMLNTDLTCKLNKTSSHKGLWEPFQKFFLQEVMKSERIVYVLCGKDSHRMDRYIFPLANTIIKLEHPAAAAHAQADWEHEKVFTTINKILKDYGRAPIFWDKKEWDEALPF